MTTTQPHILIVDDDKGIRDLLGQFLSQHDFITSLARDGKEMDRVLSQQNIDFIVLDIMLPGEDGLAICRRLRSETVIPILMLTAVGEEVDRILGLEMGADDYLSKPFNPRELLARMKAIMRRSQHSSLKDGDNEVVSGNTRYHFANWVLDTTKRQLLSPDQTEISLTSGEYGLLLAFLERSQKVLSRDQLLDITRNRSAGPFDRSIDIQISRLRHKVEEDHKNPQLIKTVRGGGYILAAVVEKRA